VQAAGTVAPLRVAIARFTAGPAECQSAIKDMHRAAKAGVAPLRSPAHAAWRFARITDRRRTHDRHRSPRLPHTRGGRLHAVLHGPSRTDRLGPRLESRVGFRHGWSGHRIRR